MSQFTHFSNRLIASVGLSLLMVGCNALPLDLPTISPFSSTLGVTSFPTPLPSGTPNAHPTATPVPGATATPNPTAAPGGTPISLPPSGASITPTGQLWYVRTDGGTAAQCNGKTDHALAGASGQNCAFSNPYYLWSNDTPNETASWKIAGGDTVIIKLGSYRMGFKGPNADGAWGFCAGNPQGCYMPPIPSGSASVHTKILGEQYANCTTKTQLHGGYSLNRVINLTQSAHVDIACLEITDYASCSRLGVGNLCHNSYPYDDYSEVGITTDIGSYDDNLIDLNIHGMSNSAIQGPVGGTINVNHVRLGFNGSAGWEFDDGNNSPMGPGAIINSQYLTVEWNGCNEEYPIAHTYPAGLCYDQASGGWAYGDGVGTSDTQLNFTCDHCNFNHNTQDGFDLAHTSGSIISITNSTSYANEGQQFKMGAMDQVTFVNNVVIGNCNRMSQAISGATPGYNASIHSGGTDLTGSRGLCRADGTAISFNLKPGGVFTAQNNTVLAYGDIMWGEGCMTGDCSSGTMSFENNVNMGYMFPGGINKQLVGLYNETGSPEGFYKHRDHNIYYNFRNSSCSTYSNEYCSISTDATPIDPKFVSAPSIAFGAMWTDESIFDNLDLHLQPSSPAYQTGIAIPGLTLHYDGVPIGANPNMGAY